MTTSSLRLPAVTTPERTASRPRTPSPAIQITTVAEIGAQLTGARTIAEVVRVLSDGVRWLLTCQQCSLALTATTHNELRTYTFRNGELDHRRIPLERIEEGLVARALTHNQPMRISSDDTNWNISVAEQEVLLPGAQSALIVPLIADGQVFGTLNFSTTRPQAYPAETLGIGRLLALQVAGSVRNALLLEELDDRETVILSLALAIEAKDPYTEGHCQRLAEYASRVGTVLGFDTAHLARLRMAAILHDVGKIAVPEAILGKTGPLTEEEYLIMQKHPVVGEQICLPLRSARDLLPAIRHHHERWDGRGYPDRLAGEEIPLDARIIAVVDTFDAMTSDRPYRRGMPVERALSIMRENKGPQWDPALLDVFIPLIESDYRAMNEDAQQATEPALQLQTMLSS